MFRNTNAIIAVGFCAIVQTAGAQGYPSRAIRVVIPFAPGGVSDLIARTIAEPLSKTLGQPVVYDNRGGAGGTLAANLVARAAPDGYTLMLGNVGNLAIAPSLYKGLSYDPQRDLAPIAMVARGQNALVVHPTLPVSSVKELVRLAKAKPGELKYASSGVGASPHLSAELFKFLAGVDIRHVPYKGSSPMLADLMGGQVELAFDNIATSLPHVKSGRLKVLAVSGSSRSPAAADIPTVEEAGIPGFVVNSYFAFAAPVATPTPVIDRLTGEITRIAVLPETQNRLLAVGLESMSLGRKPLDDTLRKERSTWARVIESAHIKIESN
jgi:tripartite-type tricarboxylate transporter receptor subunit TctC